MKCEICDEEIQVGEDFQTYTEDGIKKYCHDNCIDDSMAMTVFDKIELEGD